MLSFFRKYQKVFFIFLTVVMIFSFSFFGTYSAIFQNDGKREDRIIGENVQGEKVKESALDTMTYFISIDKNTAYGNQSAFNLFNDGVLEKDFFEVGIAHLIFDAFPEKFGKELEEKWVRMRSFSPYKHPDVPFINAETVWKHFAPEISENLKKLREQESFSRESFDLMVKLYLAEKRFTPAMLKQALVYQQRQVPGTAIDQRLYHDELTLFGFRTATDWFSKTFVETLAGFILNTSLVAEKAGYVVTDLEAKMDLFKSIQLALKSSQEINPQEAYKKQLQMLGLTEKTAVKIWKDVLTMRRYFQDHADAVLLDPMTFAHFASYASLSADVMRYQMEDPFCFKTFRDLLKYETYARAISDERGLFPPATFRSFEDIRKETPELVHRNYKLEVGSIDLDKASLKVSLKKMWDWQMQDENWKSLTKEFSAITAPSIASRSERFRILDQLDEAARAKIDRFSRKEIVKNDAEFIFTELKKTKTKVIDISVSANGDVPLEHIDHPKRFAKLLKKAPLKGQKERTSEEEEVQNELFAYSDNQEVYYKISVLDRGEEHVQTFAEALSAGFLDTLLDNELEKNFEAARKKHPKSFKEMSFYDARDLIGKYVYSDLLKEVEKTTGKNSPDDLTFYAKNRFYAYIESANERLKTNPEDKSFFKTEEMHPLIAQSKLISMKESLIRSAYNGSFFEIEEGMFSRLYLDQASLHFFQILSKKTLDPSESEAYAQGKGELEREVKEDLGKTLLEKMKDFLHYER